VLLLDTSGSMQVASLEALNQGLRTFRDDLARDTLAARRVEVAIVTFNSTVTVVQDFVTADQLEPPTLKADGLTHMGSAMHKALDMIQARKAQYRAHGVVYYRPWVFMITDGAPQGEADTIVERATQRLPYEARIAAGHFPYGRRPVPYAPAAHTLPFDVLHPTVQQLFIRCFDEGHSAPQARPDALTWRNTLDAARDALSTCPSNTQHRYGSHLRACPWCERTVRLGGRDPFPSQEAVRRRDHLRPVAHTRTQAPPRATPPRQTPPPPPPTTPHPQAPPPPRRFSAWGRLVALLLLAAVGGCWGRQSRTPGVVQGPAPRQPGYGTSS
jgi:hypothetical protein